MNLKFSESQLLHCSWESNPMFKALEDAFDTYYRDSEHLNNREARILWSDLRRYARDMGFTSSQFQEAKIRASGRLNDKKPR